MTVTVAARNPGSTANSVPTGLATALREVEDKRCADLIRFRTCCADPRASK
jgi:hypothetical protein